MRKRCISVVTVLVMLVIAFLVAGCGGKSFDIMTQHNTYWAKENTDWSKGGYVLYISTDHQADRAIFKLEYMRGEPRPQHTDVLLVKKLSEITGNEVELHFDSDSWGKSGDVKLVFDGDKIEYTISNVKDPSGSARWGFINDKGTLVKNQNAHEKLAEYNKQNVKKEESKTVQKSTRITASSILSDLGMTKEQFKNSCINISKYTGSYAEVAYSDLLKYPKKYVDMCFKTSLPVEIRHKYMSSDNYIVYDALPNGVSWYEKEQLILFDMRNDVQSPNISKGMRVTPYMIFLGVQTIDGRDYLQFYLIDVE